MANLEELRDNVAEYLNRNDLDTQIDLAINRAIQYYSRTARFWFQENIATFSTISSQFQYTTTDTGITDINKIDDMLFQLNSTTNITLHPRTYHWIRYANESNTPGVTNDYAWYENSIWLYPVPDGVYTVTVSYLKSYTTLVTGQSNDFTNNAQDLIEARALWFVYSRILKNVDLANQSKADENDALLALMTQNSRLASSKRMVATDY